MTESTRPDVALIFPDLSKDKRFFFLCKRLLDILFVLVSLPCLLPVFGLIALLILADSPGPILYVQKRVKPRRFGNGNPSNGSLVSFDCYKFRTMRVGSDDQIHRQFADAYIRADEHRMAELCPDREGAAKYKLDGDGRVTRAGNLLRRSSLDELPQLINVLKGDMTLVGPRPPMCYEVELYKPRHILRMATPQGLTGYWQVNGRGSATFEEMVEMDLKYIEQQSLLVDLSILLQTIPAVVKGNGAR